MKRAVMGLALLVSSLAPEVAHADETDPAADIRAEDAAIDQAVAEAERDALSPPAPLAVRKDKPLVTAAPTEGLGIGTKLGLCALVGGAAFWLVRARLANRGADKADRKPTDKPKVLSRTAIGLRHEVVVIEVEGQRFLLGVAPGSIASLGLLPDPPTLADEAAELPTRNTFANAKASDDDDEAPIADSLARLIAATRQTALAPAPQPRRSLENATPAATAIRPRRPLALAEAEEPAPHPRTAAQQPRRRQARPAITTSDTLPEGQVRGLSARRASQ